MYPFSCLGIPFCVLLISIFCGFRMTTFSSPGDAIWAFNVSTWCLQGQETAEAVGTQNWNWFPNRFHGTRIQPESRDFINWASQFHRWQTWQTGLIHFHHALPEIHRPISVTAPPLRYRAATRPGFTHEKYGVNWWLNYQTWFNQWRYSGQMEIIMGIYHIYF